MNNKHQELIAEKVAEFDKFLDQYTGKHNLDGLYATLFADTVKVRKDLIIKDYAQTLQDTIDTVLKGERIQLHKLIEKEAEATYAEMLKEVLRQNGLPEGGHALMNTDMMHHIIIGCVGNLSTRLNKTLDNTPPNKV